MSNLWQSFGVLVADGVLLILAAICGVTVKSWWDFFRRGCKPIEATPTSIGCHFRDGTRVVASPGSILVRVGQPGTSIAIHAPDGALLWSGKVTEVAK